MKPITLSILTAAFMVFAATGADEAEGTLTKVGDVSPVLSVKTVDNQIVDFHGKVVVLNFFATWCGPCMEEMPHLETDLWRPLKAKGLVLVSVGREHTDAEVKKFQKAKGYSFSFAADPKREVYGKFATQLIPRCIVIGKDGRIKYQSMGFAKDEFPALIRAVTAELEK
jgi:thiol-disulfide isomerase/thioredoxin